MEHPFGEALRRQFEFVECYILEHFGSRPEDEEFAQSEALDAFYLSEGYNLFNGSEKEEFILPDPLDPENRELEEG